MTPTKKTPDEIVTRARVRARLQAETAIMALGVGRLLPYQREHLLKMAEEFGEACFGEALERVLAANELSKRNGSWPPGRGYDAAVAARAHGYPATTSTEPSMGTAAPTSGPLPPGAPAAWERMSARERHEYLRDHGPDAYRALRADWERRGSPR